ncbi:MAG: twin-arginine translocase TatA/TatE family subunit [Candidatus Eremiobacterota bacterium]
MLQLLSFITMPGPTEWLIILVIALIIFGPGKLPDVGKGIGKALSEFKKASRGAKEEISVTQEKNI